MSRGIAPFALPLSVTNLDGRVYILDRDGLRLTEIEPGQVLGAPPTLKRKIEIAQAFADALNGMPT